MKPRTTGVSSKNAEDNAARWRRDFPLLSTRSHGQPLAYLDNAATTQKPRQVIDAISRYYKTGNANVHRGSHDLSNRATTAFEQARSTLAQWLGIDNAATLIWTRGTTEAINLVAQSWGNKHITSGDRILLLQSAHHANIVPWQLLAQRTGAVIDVIPLQDDNNVDLEAYRNLLQRSPKLVALSHVSNVLGTRYPIEQMCRDAKSAGACVLIDGAQALPHFDVDLRLIDCDFYAFSGHKLFGPTGIGGLWGRQDLLENMPPWQGGGEMIEHVSFTHTDFAGLPFKFEAGTPNIAGVMGLAAAIEYLKKDRAAQEAQEQMLMRHALSACHQVPGFEALPGGDQPVTLFSFLLKGFHQQDIAHWLDQKGIAVRAGHHCAMPLMQSLGLPGTVRASFAFYNTLDEAERLAHALDELVCSQKSQIDVATVTAPTLNTDPVYDAKHWDERYRALMQLAGQVERLPASLQQPEHQIPGCESRVWLITALDDQGRLACRADADARILRALVTLLLQRINGLTPAQAAEVDLEAMLASLDLQRHLSPSRGNGLLAIVRHLKTFAQSPHS